MVEELTKGETSQAATRIPKQNKRKDRNDREEDSAISEENAEDLHGEGPSQTSDKESAVTQSKKRKRKKRNKKKKNPDALKEQMEKAQQLADAKFDRFKHNIMACQDL